MSRRQATGRRGEKLAAEFLIRRGYQIIERNWRCPTGEVDLIAQKEASLVFVEVRTRRGRAYGSAEESVTPAKQARLIELAETYCQENKIENQSWRIDVVAVTLGAGQPQINHIENAVGW